MPVPKESRYPQIQESVVESWREFISGMEKSVSLLEEDIKEASEMSSMCTSEWCEATEHVIDELSNSLFSISEPRWASEEDSRKIKDLKGKVHDLYAQYKSASGK